MTSYHMTCPIAAPATMAARGRGKVGGGVWTDDRTGHLRTRPAPASGTRCCCLLVLALPLVCPAASSLLCVSERSVARAYARWWLRCGSVDARRRLCSSSCMRAGCDRLLTLAARSASPAAVATGRAAVVVTYVAGLPDGSVQAQLITARPPQAISRSPVAFQVLVRPRVVAICLGRPPFPRVGLRCLRRQSRRCVRALRLAPDSTATSLRRFVGWRVDLRHTGRRILYCAVSALPRLPLCTDVRPGLDTYARRHLNPRDRVPCIRLVCWEEQMFRAAQRSTDRGGPCRGVSSAQGGALSLLRQSS